eukprot:COSAG01_NODE_2043_length_8564_cov_76.365859_1_plen_58_part_00
MKWDLQAILLIPRAVCDTVKMCFRWWGSMHIHRRLDEGRLVPIVEALRIEHRSALAG